MLRRALLGVTLALISCSKDDPEPAPSSGFSARFELGDKPGFLSVPFPSDLYLNADGTIASDQAGMERLVPLAVGATYMNDALARTHGFGVYGGAIFELTGDAPDASKLPKGIAGDCT